MDSIDRIIVASYSRTAVDMAAGTAEQQLPSKTYCQGVRYTYWHSMVGLDVDTMIPPSRLMWRSWREFGEPSTLHSHEFTEKRILQPH